MGARINGIAFPFALGPNGIPAAATDSDAIQSDLFLLLNTVPGTRVMNRAYGVNLPAMVFENQGPILQALIRQTLTSAIRRFEPRVRLLAIKMTEDSTKMTVDIVYQTLGFTDTLTVNIDKTTGQVTQATQA